MKIQQCLRDTDGERRERTGEKDCGAWIADPSSVGPTTTDKGEGERHRCESVILDGDHTLFMGIPLKWQSICPTLLKSSKIV